MRVNSMRIPVTSRVAGGQLGSRPRRWFLASLYGKGSISGTSTEASFTSVIVRPSPRSKRLRLKCSRWETSCVMKTVLPAFARPLTARRISGTQLLLTTGNHQGATLILCPTPEHLRHLAVECFSSVAPVWHGSVYDLHRGQRHRAGVGPFQIRF